jgi:hypothetical protein
LALVVTGLNMGFPASELLAAVAPHCHLLWAACAALPSAAVARNAASAAPGHVIRRISPPYDALRRPLSTALVDT